MNKLTEITLNQLLSEPKLCDAFASMLCEQIAELTAIARFFDVVGIEQLFETVKRLHPEAKFQNYFTNQVELLAKLVPILIENAKKCRQQTHE